MAEEEGLPGGVGNGFGSTSKTRSFSLLGKNVASFGTKFEFKVPGLKDTTKDLNALNSELDSLQKKVTALGSAGTPAINKFFSAMSTGAKSALNDVRALNREAGGTGGGMFGGSGSGASGRSTMFGGSGAGGEAATQAGLGAGSATNSVISSVFNPIGNSGYGIGGMVQAVGEIAFKPVQLAYNRTEENRAAMLRAANYLGSVSNRGGGGTIEQLIQGLGNKIPIQGSMDDMLSAMNVGSRMGFGADFSDKNRNGGFWTAARQLQTINPGVAAGDIVGSLGGYMGNAQAVQKSVMFSGGAFSFQKGGGGQKSMQEWADGLLKFFENQRPGRMRGKAFTREELMAQQFPGSNINAWFSLNEVPQDMTDAFWQYAISKKSMGGGGGTWDEIIGTTRGGDMAFERLKGETSLARRDFAMGGQTGLFSDKATGTSSYDTYVSRERTDRDFQNALSQTLDKLIPMLTGILGISTAISKIPTPVAEMLYRLASNAPTALAKAITLAPESLEAFGFGGSIETGQPGASQSNQSRGQFGDPGWGPTGSTSLFGMTPTMQGRMGAMMADNPNIQINSGYRDGGTQSRLFNAGAGAVAPPGQSTHAAGVAADIGPEDQYAWIAANAGRYGLQVAGDEPWHVGLPGTMPIMGDPKRSKVGGIGDVSALGGIGGAILGGPIGSLIGPGISSLGAGLLSSLLSGGLTGALRGATGSILGAFPGMGNLLSNPSGTTAGFLQSGGNMVSSSGLSQLLGAAGLGGGGNFTNRASAVGQALGTGDGSKHVTNKFDKFAQDILQKLGMPVTPSNVRAINAWAQAEGNNSSYNNPLATTKTWAGAQSMNSHGVKKYSSYEDGVGATVATLNMGYYDSVRAALKKGDSAKAVGLAVKGSPWGTGQGVLNVLGDPRHRRAAMGQVLALGGGDHNTTFSGGVTYAISVYPQVQVTRGGEGDLTRVANTIATRTAERLEQIVQVHG